MLGRESGRCVTAGVWVNWRLGNGKKFVTGGPGLGLVPTGHLTFFAKEDCLASRPSLTPRGVEASPSGLWPAGELG